MNTDDHSAPVTASRRAVHRRVIDAQGYLCDDGLWDIEAILTDTKDYAFDNHDRGIIDGAPLHRMRVCLRVDDHFVIQQVKAETLYAPYALCPAIAQAYQSLSGLKISSGFTRQVQKSVGGIQGCTHITEMVRILATVAIQTIRPDQKHFLWNRQAGDIMHSTGQKLPQSLRRTCHVFADDTDVSARVFD